MFLSISRASLTNTVAQKKRTLLLCTLLIMSDLIRLFSVSVLQLSKLQTFHVRGCISHGNAIAREPLWRSYEMIDSRNFSIAASYSKFLSREDAGSPNDQIIIYLQKFLPQIVLTDNKF